MAWTYHDYLEQSTNALRLARLRQHISEVNQEIQADLRDGERSKENEHLVKYKEGLLTELERLAGKVSDIDTSDPRVKAGFTRARPL